MTVAVFSSGSNLILVRLEADANESVPAEAAARGYNYAGSIAVSSGVHRVQIEPGFAVAMIYAAKFSRLGTQLKQEQMEAAHSRGERGTNDAASLGTLA
jgi:hypothetical protein